MKSSNSKAKETNSKKKSEETSFDELEFLIKRKKKRGTSEKTSKEEIECKLEAKGTKRDYLAPGVEAIMKGNKKGGSSLKKSSMITGKDSTSISIKTSSKEMKLFHQLLPHLDPLFPTKIQLLEQHFPSHSIISSQKNELYSIHHQKQQQQQAQSHHHTNKQQCNFTHWLEWTQLQYNLLFYGIGNKKTLFIRFIEEGLKWEDVLLLDGGDRPTSGYSSSYSSYSSSYSSSSSTFSSSSSSHLQVSPRITRGKSSLIPSKSNTRQSGRGEGDDDDEEEDEENEANKLKPLSLNSYSISSSISSSVSSSVSSSSFSGVEFDWLFRTFESNNNHNNNHKERAGGGGGGGRGGGGGNVFKNLLDTISIQLLRNRHLSDQAYSLSSYTALLTDALNIHYGRITTNHTSSYSSSPSSSSLKKQQQIEEEEEEEEEEREEEEREEEEREEEEREEEEEAEMKEKDVGLVDNNNKNNNHQDWERGKLYLLVPSIDGAVLRDPEIQHCLSLLASCPSICLIASCDNLNVSLLWSQMNMIRYNWKFIHLPTFLPYSISTELEMKMELKTTKKELGVSSFALTPILHSLTKEHQEVFRLIAHTSYLSLQKQEIQLKNQQSYQQEMKKYQQQLKEYKIELKKYEKLKEKQQKQQQEKEEKEAKEKEKNKHDKGKKIGKNDKKKNNQKEKDKEKEEEIEADFILPSPPILPTPPIPLSEQNEIEETSEVGGGGVGVDKGGLTFNQLFSLVSRSLLVRTQPLLHKILRELMDHRLITYQQPQHNNNNNNHNHKNKNKRTKNQSISNSNEEEEEEVEKEIEVRDQNEEMEREIIVSIIPKDDLIQFFSSEEET